MRFRRIIATIVVLSAALAVWGFGIEPASLRNESAVIHLPRWPMACDGLRVAVLADLHVGSPHVGLSKLKEVVQLTNQASPDLILLAGDFVIQGVVGGRFVPPEESAVVLANLKADAGVYAVLGNHDWWLDASRVRSSLERVGIPVLDDSARLISSDACEFWLAGVSDFWEGAHDVDQALRLVPQDATVLLFTHNPDVFPQIPERVALTIAGHTHGGQVYIPGLGRPIVPSQFGERFAIGHIEEGGRHLFVSSGVGTSIIPIRFLVPPEVSVIDLRIDRIGSTIR